MALQGCSSIVMVVVRRAASFLELIKFEHTVFALPFAYLGMLIAAASVLAYVVVIVQRWFQAESFMDGVRAIWDRDILQFFLTGMVLFGLGLLGEYIGRIYEQVRQRPRFLIQAVLEQDSGERQDASLPR